MFQYEVTIPQIGPGDEASTVTVEAPHWHTAFKEAFASLGMDAPSQLMFDISNDESLIKITDTEVNRVIQIRDLSKTSKEEPETPVVEAPATEEAGATILAIPAFSSEDIGPPPTAASAFDGAQTVAGMSPFEEQPASTGLSEHEKEEIRARHPAISFDSGISIIPEDNASSGLSEQEKEEIRARHPAISLTTGAPAIGFVGDDPSQTSQYLAHDSDARPNQYQGAGMTTEVLADAFMRAMDIYDYGDDRNGAMQFAFELALDQLEAQGGGVLLTDRNSPENVLWYEIAAGDAADTLLNLRIPIGRGAAGKSVQNGAPLNIVNLKEDPAYVDDHLLEIGVDTGPLVVAPIQHGGAVYGAILLYRWGFGQPYTQGETSILGYIAHTAGEYLQSLT